MNTPRSLTLAFSLIAFGSIAQTAGDAFRTWTSTDGKKIEASFLGVEAGGVKIKMRAGNTFTVPLDRLSAEDQAFVKEQQSKPEAPATTPGTAGRPAAGKEWPRNVALDDPPEPQTIKEDKDAHEFIYRSQHYEFRCDSKLGANVVREFCRIFESTWKLNCLLPLDFKPAPEEGQDYFVAKLYTNKQDYFNNGGIAGSAGVYMTRDKALSVPLSSLGVKMVGTRVSLEKANDDDNATLIHEITHQMMNHWLGRIPTWFAEGSAECVEMLEYQRGRFSLTGMRQRLSHYVKRQGGDGKNFTMIDPQELFDIDFPAWAAALSGPRGLASQNYGSAALMTFFFYHIDGSGDSANMIAYLREIENARKKEDLQAAFQKHLLRDRSIEQIKSEIKKGFRKDGLNIEFSPPGRNAVRSSQQ